MKLVVHIGPTAGRIEEITEDRVRYVDDTGTSREIHLLPVLGSDDRCIGFRKLDGPPWAGWLGTEDRVEFRFETCEAAYQCLLTPLSEVDRFTLDGT